MIDLEVWDLKHLNAIIAGIRDLPISAEAGRVFEQGARLARQFRRLEITALSMTGKAQKGVV